MRLAGPRYLVAVLVCGVATSCAAQNASTPVSGAADAYNRLVSAANARRGQVRMDLQNDESRPAVATGLKSIHDTTDAVRVGVRDLAVPSGADGDLRALLDALQNEEGVELSLSNAAQQGLPPFDTADRSEVQRSLDDTGRESLHYSNRVRHDLGLPPAPHDVEQAPYLL
jgi:hypothetical protein